MCDHEARAAPPTASGSGTAHLDTYTPPASSAAPATASGSNTFPGNGTVPWVTVLSHASHVPSPLSQGELAPSYAHSQSHGSGSPPAGDAAAHASPQHSPDVSAPPHSASFASWSTAFNDESQRSNSADGVALLSETALASSQGAATHYGSHSQQAASRNASPERAAATAGRGMPMPAASYSQAPPTASISPAMLVGTQYAPLLLQNQELQQQQHMQRQQQQYHLQQRMQQQQAQQAQQPPQAQQKHAQYGQARPQPAQQQEPEQQEQQPNAFQQQNASFNSAAPVGLSAQDEALFNQLRESPLLGHYLQHTFGDLHRRIEAAGRHNDDVRQQLQTEERAVTAQRVEVNSLAAEQRRWAAAAEEWSLLRTHELDAWEQRLAHRSLLLMQRENAVGLQRPSEAEQARAEALVTNSSFLQSHSSFLLPTSSSSAAAPPIRRSSALQERGQNGSSQPSVNSPAQQEQEVVEPPLKKKRASPKPKTRGTSATAAKRGSGRAPRMTKAKKLAQAQADEAAADAAAAAAVAAATGSVAVPAVVAESSVAARTRANDSPLFSPRPSTGEKEFAGTAFAGAAPLARSAATSASPPAAASASAPR